MKTLAIAVAIFLLTPWLPLPSGEGELRSSQAIRIDGDDIAGTVTGPKGPEAGVWVIAETSDLPTKFVRIVVTDDRGRYLLPDLPKANYAVWVRGYGLVDSPKVRAIPGRTLDLTAAPAPDPRSAAEYYPAGYWLSLLRVPLKSEFAGTPAGNGAAPAVRSQAEWLRITKSGTCLACHQLGNKATREIPAALGQFESSVAAWDRRVRSGQAGGAMSNTLNQLGRERALAMFADWTDRIAAGEVPPAPPRPQGLERNVVITLWDWADPKAYLHDVVSTDRRNPSVNPNGPLHGALEASADYLPVLDPVRHAASRIPLTVRDPNTRPSAAPTMPQPSPYWGDEAIWTSKNNVHNPMLDGRGRVWITSTVRPPDNPDFCRAGSSHPSAQLFPVARAGRHLAVYDPKAGKLTHISTCFSTHHLMFAEDASNTLWTSGGGPVVGWLNTKLFDETGDEQASQGWTALILDANGNGRRDAYVEPDQPVDPTKDKRIAAGFYSVAPAPDGSIWGTSLGFPGALVRLSPGSNPPATALAEVFEPPLDARGEPVEGFSPRGGDVDRSGVYWAAMASGHLASFDRRKCKGPLNGPTATGQHCPEGWTFYTEPLPQLQGVTDPGSAEASYYTWVDQFDALGLGRNVPINTGNESEGLLVLKDGKWVVLRVPYPLGFYTKWLDGRIDDANGGWKGRGLWATVSTRAPFHMEGGKGTTSKVVRFQLRPDPLAR
ncbi:MAG TPA: carboxypeptidase-like regulatory domain-containing protein [Gemmatimonadales bacterium]|nr:carboxypeptidase-like regulatory domain-containing protein [Gemmatimonadales bacterium]